MIRAALYARYSDRAQNETSIEQQFRLLRERAKVEGWTVVAEFEDRALTGTNDFRPGFQKLKEAALAGSCDVVLAESCDRLARDTEILAGLHKRLSFRGVSIVTLHENEVDDGVVALKGYSASIYSKQLSKRVHRGQHQLALQGKSAGWAYGYDVCYEFAARGQRIGEYRVVNQFQAVIVRRIFEEYVSGKSPRKIAFDLNAEGVPSQSGRKWRDSTIYGNRRRGTGVLNNILYIGTLRWNVQSFSVDPDTGHANGTINDESKWVLTEVPHLRIIDDELWQRAKAKQRQLDESSPSNSGKQRGRRLFSFLLKCGQCGGGYSRVGATQSGCSNARNKGPSVCTNRLCISEKRLKEYVFTALEDHIMDPVLSRDFARVYGEHIKQVNADNSSAQASNRAELEKTERAIEKLADAVAQGIDPTLLRGKADDLKRRKDDLLQALQFTPKAPIFVHPNMGHRFRKAVRQIIAAFELEAYQSENTDLIRGLIHSVVLTPDRERKDLKIDVLGDLEGIIRASAPERKAAAYGAARIAEHFELGHIRTLAGRLRCAPPINPASHRRLPVSDNLQNLMAGAKASHQDLHHNHDVQDLMAGAAGFEPANAGTKNRCLTAWRRPKGISTH